MFFFASNTLTATVFIHIKQIPPWRRTIVEYQRRGTPHLHILLLDRYLHAVSYRFSLDTFPIRYLFVRPPFDNHLYCFIYRRPLSIDEENRVLVCIYTLPLNEAVGSSPPSYFLLHC